MQERTADGAGEPLPDLVIAFISNEGFVKSGACAFTKPLLLMKAEPRRSERFVFCRFAAARVKTNSFLSIFFQTRAGDGRYFRIST